jgi:hypothetical protein
MSYTFTLLTTSDSIGDSLSSINQNYLNLETWIDTIQLSADNYWIPFINYYKSFMLELKDNIKKSNLVLNNWKQVSTTVEANSSKWIEPLIIYYPTIIQTNSQVNLNDLSQSALYDVTSWLNTNFSILNNDCYNGICYTEKQEAIVHVILKNSPRYDDQKFEISDSTTCYTSNTIVSAPCKVTFSGDVTQCNGGIYHCNGSVSCNPNNSVNCVFPNGLKSNKSTITAYLYYNFYDTYDNKNILRLKYRVSNCSWVYISKV